MKMFFHRVYTAWVLLKYCTMSEPLLCSTAPQSFINRWVMNVKPAAVGFLDSKVLWNENVVSCSKLTKSLVNSFFVVVFCVCFLFTRKDTDVSEIISISLQDNYGYFCLKIETLWRYLPLIFTRGENAIITIMSRKFSSLSGNKNSSRSKIVINE